MSVADQLGHEDQTGELLVLTDQRWGYWAATCPALAGIAGVGDLRERPVGADWAEAHEVLHALATLAAVNGRDDLGAGDRAGLGADARWGEVS